MIFRGNRPKRVPNFRNHITRDPGLAQMSMLNDLGQDDEHEQIFRALIARNASKAQMRAHSEALETQIE